MKANKKQAHWEKVYDGSKTEQLGWYEEPPLLSLKLVEQCGISSSEPLIDVGVGASTFIDHLIERGHTSITAVDISSKALDTLKARLGEERASAVRWVVDDITAPAQLNQIKDIALWHDRALLHFLLEEEERASYRKVLGSVLRSGGYAIIAAFSIEGAPMCSGLNLHRYDEASLVEFMGDEFRLIESVDYVYHQPSGDPRPYIYTLFQKK